MVGEQQRCEDPRYVQDRPLTGHEFSDLFDNPGTVEGGGRVGSGKLDETRSVDVAGEISPVAKEDEGTLTHVEHQGRYLDQR
jgi:hypothetical protein